MSRRGSRTSHKHAIRVLDADKTGIVSSVGNGIWGRTWCGKESDYNTLSGWKEGEDKLAYSRRMSNCPACSAAIGKARIAQLAGRVTLEKVELIVGKYGSSYRSGYLVRIDGQDMGHVVMRNGWGNPWELKELPNARQADNYTQFGGGTVSCEPSIHYPPKADDLQQIVHSASKEMMACLAFRMRERGESLFTLEERAEAGRIATEKRLADEAERAANKIKYQAEAERKNALRVERRELAYETVKAALGAATTNAEIAGFMAAIDIITGKDVQ